MSDYIPEGIQVEILKLLPVKSLLRFRCVCKWWNQHIDSPSFVQDHLTLQKPRFLLDRGEEFIVLDPVTLPLFDTLNQPRTLPPVNQLIGTLHGVVCFFYNHLDILLWNPAIRKSSSIPQPDPLKLGLDGIEIETCGGFWIDPFTKVHKVLLFDSDDGGPGILYSSIQQDWKLIPRGDRAKFISLQHTPPVVIKGVAYWNGYGGSHIDVSSFDFEHEIFDYIVAPPVKAPPANSSWSDDDNAVLYNWKGTLSLVYFYAEDSNKCDIYLRQDDSWVNVFSFNLITRLGRGYVLSVMGETEQVQENMRILASFSGELVLCDTKGGCIPVKNCPKGTTYSLAYDFVESLLHP